MNSLLCRATAPCLAYLRLAFPRLTFPRLTFLCLALFIGGCNSSSTGLPEDTAPGGSGGGIGGSGITSYSVGTLTGFGSVFINGSRFDTATSNFLVNGQAANQSQLRVGMQLVARVDFDTAAAEQVDYSASLIGPVTSMPDAMGRLRVLNQTVVVGAGTVLDSLTLAELTTQRVIEVSGVADANGNLIASYIRPALNNPLNNAIQMTGAVSAVDNNQQRITLRNVSVDIDQADVSAFNSMPLATGTVVRVTAPLSQYDASANTLVASTVEPGNSISPSEDGRIEVTGFVQTFNSISSFGVDGLQITTRASTQYAAVDGSTLNASAVSVNSLIEIEGRFLSTGVVDAERIVILPVENSELVGRLEAIDANARIVTVLGVPIRTTSLTRFRGDDDSIMNFDSLRVGDYAEIDASFTSSGLLATKIEIDELEDESSLEGPVTQLDTNQRRIEIAGVSIAFNDETDFEIEQNNNDQSVNEQAFINALSTGTIVKATWDGFTSTAEPVDELEID